MTQISSTRVEILYHISSSFSNNNLKNIIPISKTNLTERYRTSNSRTINQHWHKPVIKFIELLTQFFLQEAKNCRTVANLVLVINFQDCWLFFSRSFIAQKFATHVLFLAPIFSMNTFFKRGRTLRTLLACSNQILLLASELAAIFITTSAETPWQVPLFNTRI